jgi:hypothetical protein
MAHWYLKSMRIPAPVRNEFQQASTFEQVHALLAEIARQGPACGARDAPLDDWQVSVPSGPVSHW